MRPDVADLLGLKAGLRVVAGLGDGQAAGLGVGITGAGEAYLNLGTGIVSGGFSADYVTDRAFRTMTGGVPGTYLLETLFGGGTYNIRWFVERFSGIGAQPVGLDISTEQILEAAASQLPAGAEGLMALPYLTGVLSPYWASNARGAMVGLSVRHGKSHFYPAILEGLAFEQRQSTMGAKRVTFDRFLDRGSGSRSALWCQIIVETLGRPVHIAREAEATCLGAGILAAVGAGHFDNAKAAAAAKCGTGKRYALDPRQPDKYDRLYDIYKDIYPALRDSFARMRVAMDDIG